MGKERESLIEPENVVNGYMLTRIWFDFAFENQGFITGNHGCMYLWFIEQRNRYGWPEQFGAPREQTMAAVGMTSYTTYKKVFTDLVTWGFVKVVTASKNQFTANIIALPKNDKATYKALDKALSLQQIKQCESNMQGTIQDTVSINKPLNYKTIVVVEKGKNENSEQQKKEEEIFEKKIDANFEPIETEVQEEITHVDFEIDEEEYAAAETYLKSQSRVYITLQSQQKISAADCLKLFRTFYEQKMALEHGYKTPKDMLDNFFFWVPKHLISTRPKKATQNGNANNNTRTSSKGVASHVTNREERNDLVNGLKSLLLGTEPKQ